MDYGHARQLKVGTYLNNCICRLLCRWSILTRGIRVKSQICGAKSEVQQMRTVFVVNLDFLVGSLAKRSFAGLLQREAREHRCFLLGNLHGAEVMSMVSRTTRKTSPGWSMRWASMECSLAFAQQDLLQIGLLQVGNPKPLMFKHITLTCKKETALHRPPLRCRVAVTSRSVADSARLYGTLAASGVWEETIRRRCRI